MFSQNQRLSLRQGRALLLLSAWGPSVLLLPRLLWEAGGPNGWQLLVGAALPVFFLLWLTARCPGESPFSPFPTPARRGSFSRRLLALLLAVKQLAAAGLLLRFVAPLVQAQLLPRTPPVVPVLLLLLCALYPLSKGLEVRGRLAEVLCVLVFFPLLLAAALALIHSRWAGLLPLSPLPLPQLATGSLRLLCLLPGPELLWLLSFHLPTVPSRAKGLLLPLLGLWALLLGLCLATLGSYGPAVLHKPWPALEWLEGLRLPGAFLDRLGGLLLWVWAGAAFAQLSATLYWAAHLLAWLGLPQPAAIWLSAGLALLCYFGLPLSVAGPLNAVGWVLAPVLALWFRRLRRDAP